MGLRLLACWDCRFESRRKHGCLSVVSVVCCAGGGTCVGLITRPHGSHRLWCAWVWSWILDNEETLAHCRLLRHGKIKLLITVRDLCSFLYNFCFLTYKIINYIKLFCVKTLRYCKWPPPPLHLVASDLAFHCCMVLISESAAVFLFEGLCTCRNVMTLQDKVTWHSN